jgi:hypothetical protein
VRGRKGVRVQRELRGRNSVRRGRRRRRRRKRRRRGRRRRRRMKEYCDV